MNFKNNHMTKSIARLRKREGSINKIISERRNIKWMPQK